ncbi:uncharacterized protein MELLADRAFT_58958 [Melampsora larici-populina 98AG31]|uniref:Uncharacterized protein n=1 Tax=Melampsora larici-populina (strain 98AG31 / pathotype 3-4-7) TaxID=747676 RepID=F4R6J0_MELLP|nr:uncharacterized protein MELLADRAFT_58958 [Melampsora larici-populina 98AG31]EGG12456.1 hypothetical protein MELLADRAFT_58958 [Melampsora larici-populina 98AG31]
MPDTQLTPPINYDVNQLFSKLDEARKSECLGFLISLDEDINYRKRLCSMGKLREMMDILGINQENLTARSKKDAVVKHYRKNAAPVVDKFVLFLNKNSTSKSLQPVASTSNQSRLNVNGRVRMSIDTNPLPEFSTSAIADSNSTPNSSTEDLPALVQKGRQNSKVEDLCEVLKKSVNKFLSHGFSKGALVKLQAHAAEITGKGMGRSAIKPGDLRRPYLLSQEEMSKKDRDSIRQTLQVWCPQLWIPLNVATSKPILLALYNLICLEIDEPSLCQGVHYDIFPMEELKVEGRFTF